MKKDSQYPSSELLARYSFDILEPLAHLVCYIKRRICDDASVWFQLSFV